MPDPKEMSGIPRPVDDLPAGAVSVRLIRGSLSNNITGHPVELRVGPKVITVKTDENGRAEFKDLPPGTPVKASADVDGEHLESQEFPAPARGGIRLMLVATDPTKKAAVDTPAQTGPVVIGEQSRFVMQPREEAVEVFYLLDIANNLSVPVNPPTPFAFDMPAGGDVFIAATGGPVTAGQAIELTVDGVPHHSQAPRRIALALALVVALTGTWFATRPTGDAAAQAAEKKRLVARREKLFNELMRLEHDRRNGRADDRRYASRRDELVASLEQVYSALDAHDTGPEPAGRTALSAPLDVLRAS